MRVCSDRARALIEAPADVFGGGFGVEWVADLMYDGERRLQDVPITDVEMQWDGSSFVQGSGSVRVVWADDFGRSMIPRQVGDWFSPFGAELQLDVIISAGHFRERIPMGRFVIDDVPDANDARLLFMGREISPGQSFTLSLKDRLVKVARDEFPLPSAPRTTSAWSEVQRVTSFPVVRTVADAGVPRALAYEGAKRDVVNKLFDLMDAWPQLSPAGALLGLPKAWGVPVGAIRGVVSAPVSLSSENTFNAVVVEGKSPDGDPIFATVDVRDGFLRTRNENGGESPFGSKTLRYENQGLDTQSKVTAYARSLLGRVSRVNSVTREVVEPFNPLREVGDVLTFKGGRVRVQKIRHRGAETSLVVDVAD